ncbi:hypothetical protein T484DRAFT_3536521 [Baffinella frigidus]|nr:hypothetical protein T484DRAFT_3536521 [Cryptophyta sp. CCMP2293]
MSKTFPLGGRRSGTRRRTRPTTSTTPLAPPSGPPQPQLNRPLRRNRGLHRYSPSKRCILESYPLLWIPTDFPPDFRGGRNSAPAMWLRCGGVSCETLQQSILRQPHHSFHRLVRPDRNPKSKIRNPKAGTWNPKSGIRNPNPKTTEPETLTLKPAPQQLNHPPWTTRGTLSEFGPGHVLKGETSHSV